jgi:hypothetical protein
MIEDNSGDWEMDFKRANHKKSRKFTRLNFPVLHILKCVKYQRALISGLMLVD